MYHPVWIKFISNRQTILLNISPSKESSYVSNKGNEMLEVPYLEKVTVNQVIAKSDM